MTGSAPAALPKLKIVYREPETLVPYERNPRRIPEAAVEACRRSYRAFGMRNPIIVDVAGGMIVVAGHTRLKAALAEELPEVPTIDTAGLTPEQIKAYRIADNRIAAMTGEDPELLDAEIKSMEEAALRDGLADAMAVDEAYINRLFSEAGGEEAGGRANEKVEPLDGPTITQPGDLIVLGRHRLLCGDATKVEDVAALLNGATPRLMVTDPPYGVDYDPDWRNRHVRSDGSPIGASAVMRPKNDERADWREAWKLAPSDVVYVWHASLYGVDVFESVRDAGFVFRSQIIWAKSTHPISRGNYHWQHEACLYAIRKGQSARWVGGRKQTTIWQIPKAAKLETGHSTQKPIECMERPIRNHEGDVYDPFVGSGTTILAAERQGRTCYAMEVSPAFCDVVVRRWASVTGTDDAVIYTPEGHVRDPGAVRDPGKGEEP